MPELAPVTSATSPRSVATHASIPAFPPAVHHGLAPSSLCVCASRLRDRRAYGRVVCDGGLGKCASLRPPAGHGAEPATPAQYATTLRHDGRMLLVEGREQDGRGTNRGGD